ncbi:hypothetical protein [Puniceibacterium sediminis]|uniref:Uncharacterized protein n=1 Tax=Puniceibacterium sediminis TaxID=1608407 RepID=A0A238VTW8_9RHOB|nr:hypothetical protein [Puniceibacterium sediminis]SNR37243.1 hypothetical protein SAMN06265370_103102 [Puniceibacterium sediminis]
MANSYIQMRQAGATARAMFVAAVAEKWDVPAREITVEDRVVSHAASGQSSSFGDRAEVAALQEVPVEPALKTLANSS